MSDVYIPEIKLSEILKPNEMITLYDAESSTMGLYTHVGQCCGKRDLPLFDGDSLAVIEEKMSIANSVFNILCAQLGQRIIPKIRVVMQTPFTDKYTAYRVCMNTETNSVVLVVDGVDMSPHDIDDKYQGYTIREIEYDYASRLVPQNATDGEISVWYKYEVGPSGITFIGSFPESAYHIPNGYPSGCMVRDKGTDMTFEMLSLAGVTKRSAVESNIKNVVYPSLLLHKCNELQDQMQEIATKIEQIETIGSKL